MTLTIELAPEQERALQEEAARRGVPPEECARNLLMLCLSCTETSKPDETREDEEFEAALDAFSEGTEHLPPLPQEANSRAWIY